MRVMLTRGQRATGVLGWFELLRRGGQSPGVTVHIPLGALKVPVPTV
jgi:hypothetical protein